MSFVQPIRRVCGSHAVVLAGSLLAAGCAATSPPPSTPPVCPEPSATEEVAKPAPAPSLSLWTEGATRKAIEDFVARVTDEGSPDFVPPSERIAVFDNDGTLWSEQPVYVQLAFTLDRLEQLAPGHPEWKRKQPFKAALAGDLKTVAKSGTEGLLQLIVATHAGVSPAQFEKLVTEWLETARHPIYDQRYTELVYLPMVELLGYLRAHGFKTFIVSGGGVAFMRPWTEAAYGIPPESVVGSRIKTTWQEGGEGPAGLRRLPEVDFIDDGPGKPVGIEQAIGRRPVFAAGNSDGDLQMLQWTTANERPSLSLLVHHTDAERESAYDRKSAMGKLDKALDQAGEEGWVVVDMKEDWKRVFSFEAPTARAPAAE